MCLGACTLHRISKIVYALPDNFTGSIKAVDKNTLPVGYKEIFPEIEVVELFRKESQELLAKYMNEHKSPKWDVAKKLLGDVE
jgi:tRNA(Arg) A34 adenosine deaminase TadA